MEMDMKIISIFKLQLFSLLISCVLAANTQATEPQLPSIKIATLKFGTLNWELDTMSHQQFDRQQGFQVEPLTLASMTATRTALMSGTVDVIVADWIWVSQQRQRGIPLQFIPYSSSIGKLMVAKDSSIRSLKDLAGKRLGIAGGPADKGWLLLRAGALKQGLDLKKASQQQYAAPPLLNAALEQKQLDAVITFWHYAARLEGKGYRTLLNLKQISQEFGLDSELPMLGFVFRQQWAQQHPQQIKALQLASQATKQHLRNNPSTWQRIRPLMGSKTDAVFERLKVGYVAGIPGPEIKTLQQQAQQMYRLLADTGGNNLMGSQHQLDPDTFWTASDKPTN